MDSLLAQPRPLLIGHRGAPALAPENSLRSLEFALEQGADSFEVDIVALPDGTLAAAHSLERAQRGSDVATLEQVLDLARRRLDGRPFLIDVKSAGYEPALVGALRERGLASQALVCSLDRSVLARLRSLAPEVAGSLSYPADRRSVSEIRLLAPIVPAFLRVLGSLLPRRLGAWLDRTGARAVTLHHGVVGESVVRLCHGRGIAVIAWTVDDDAQAARLKGIGIDAIITNNPRLRI